MESGICLRCGAPYEPEDTVCYKCGAPIGVTRANTQPVRAVRMPKPEPATVQTASQPAAHAPTAAQTPSLARPGPAPILPVSRMPRRRARWPVILLGCLLVLLALGAAAYELRMLNATPPVAHQTLYTDSQGRFSFQRPTLWEAHPSASGVSLNDSDGISTARVTVEAAPPGQSAQAVADARATALGLGLQPQRQVASVTWEQRAGQVTGQDGAVREDVILVTLHDERLYTIEFTCPISSYDATNALVYQPLLDSFTFGAASPGT